MEYLLMKVQSPVRNLEYNNNAGAKAFSYGRDGVCFRNTREQIEKNIFKYS